MQLVAVAAALVLLQCVSATIWDPVDQVILDAIDHKVFPGAVALVGDKKGILYAKAFGSYTYGLPPPFDPNRNPPMEISTYFDMASCSKIIASTTSAALLYQSGLLDLDARVTTYLGAAYAANGKGAITVRNLLLHNAGLPPDPVVDFASPKFGCPAMQQSRPQEAFTCQKLIFQSVLNVTLIHPVGQVYVYSDLSMITLMFVLGQVIKDNNLVTPKDLLPNCDSGTQGAAQCYFEAYVRLHVVPSMNLSSTMYLPPKARWSECAPTENDTIYRHEVMQGQVHDENAFAMGGVSGHAGVFSTILDMYTFMSHWLYASPQNSILNSTTTALFTKEYNHSQSSRALGWNTNDPNVFDEGWDLLCGNLSSRTFMHVGYTGTMLCGDPERELAVVLLTNRVYPTRNGPLIAPWRRLFSTTVQKIYDQFIRNASVPLFH